MNRGYGGDGSFPKAENASACARIVLRQGVCFKVAIEFRLDGLLRSRTKSIELSILRRGRDTQEGLHLQERCQSHERDEPPRPTCLLVKLEGERIGEKFTSKK